MVFGHGAYVKLPMVKNVKHSLPNIGTYLYDNFSSYSL